MTDIIVLCLFGGGALFALLGALPSGARPLWALLAAACVVAGVLASLALGLTLAQLQGPVLAVCAAAMAAMLLGKGDGQG